MWLYFTEDGNILGYIAGKLSSFFVRDDCVESLEPLVLLATSRGAVSLLGRIPHPVRAVARTDKHTQNIIAPRNFIMGNHIIEIKSCAMG